MRRWLSLAAAILALTVTPMAGTASQDSVHFGPFDSASPDSGTCGNDWAKDTFKRVFDASTSPNKDGTYSVTETFIDGRFVTLPGSSPGACNKPGAPTGGMIQAGVEGSFNGNFQVLVTGGSFNPDARCEWVSCHTTSKFVKTIYGSTATFGTGPSFGFTYHANGPELLDREWFNASPDQGGNHGDIRST